MAMTGLYHREFRYLVLNFSPICNTSTPCRQDENTVSFKPYTRGIPRSLSSENCSFKEKEIWVFQQSPVPSGQNFSTTSMVVRFIPRTIIDMALNTGIIFSFMNTVSYHCFNVQYFLRFSGRLSLEVL